MVENLERKGGVAKAMIDSGNTLRNGVGISEEFRKKMGFKLTEKSKHIGTANKKSQLKQIGETEVIKVTITGIQATWTGKASVFQELSDPINIGTACLIKMGEKKGQIPYLAFHKNGTRMGWMNQIDAERELIS